MVRIQLTSHKTQFIRKFAKKINQFGWGSFLVACFLHVDDPQRHGTSLKSYSPTEKYLAKRGRKATYTTLQSEMGVSQVRPGSAASSSSCRE